MMSDASEWRMVYLVPAVLGIIVSFIALMSLRETDAFIESRLKFLRMTDGEREAEKIQRIHHRLRAVLLPHLSLFQSIISSVGFMPPLRSEQSEF